MTSPRPLRVLCASGDERVLAVLGNAPRVALETGTPAGLLGQARRHRPDVIVLDGRDAAGAVPLRCFGWRVLLVGSAGGLGARVSDLTTRSVVEAPDALLAETAVAAGRPGTHLDAGPPVSVVVTVLDEERAIPELLRQVRLQLRADDELVVVDGGSADGSMALLRDAAADDGRVTVLDAPKTNIAQGRNVGIRHARHDVIATTDAGCTLSPGWLEALRLPFAASPAPGLVAGNCLVTADSPFERAQALGCYPVAHESEHPTLPGLLYGRLFGIVFNPTLPFARSLAFTRRAWEDAGGFPEDIRWTEDGVFGQRVADAHRCVFAADARVTWDQHATPAATFRMYRAYGRGAATSGSPLLVARDATRALAYVLAGAAIASRRRALLAPVAVMSGAYLSLPMSRVVRDRAGLGVAARIPLAMMLKDIGKLSGAASELAARRSRRPGGAGA